MLDINDIKKILLDNPGRVLRFIKGDEKQVNWFMYHIISVLYWPPVDGMKHLMQSINAIKDQHALGRINLNESKSTGIKPAINSTKKNNNKEDGNQRRNEKPVQKHTKTGFSPGKERSKNS